MEETSSSPDLALIGCGYWGKNLARNFHDLGVLHTLCDLNQVLLDAYGEEYAGVRKSLSLDDVLKDSAITKVAIAAPAALHYRIARSALLAGKDVFVEKPLCLEEKEGRELVEMAEKQGRILMVGHLLQYHPSIQKLRSVIAEGELGKLHYITSHRLNLGKFRREENALWSFAPHDVSVILSLAGHEVPKQVRCMGEGYLNTGVADTTITTLKFAGGIRAHVYVSWLNPFKEQKLTVVGSNGMAVFDDTRSWEEKLVLFRQPVTWENGQVPIAGKVKGEKVIVPEAEPLRNECQHFLECCANRRQPLTDGAEGLRVLEVLQAAQQSLDRDGEAVCAGSAGMALSSNAPSGAGHLQTLGSELSPADSDYFGHPTAVIDAGAIIGKRTKIWHFSHVMKGAVIGEGCVLGQNVNVDGGTKIGNNVKIQNNVSIYTGIQIEDDVFLGPSCVLTNVTNPRSQVNRHQLYEKTLIRRGATVGANATILCGVTLGRYCFIGAGAVVTKDVADYALMLGNPARKSGWMSRHGHVLHAGPDQIMRCPESGLRYRESSPGLLECLDLCDDSPLPEGLDIGRVTYRRFKAAVEDRIDGRLPETG